MLNRFVSRNALCAASIAGALVFGGPAVALAREGEALSADGASAPHIVKLEAASSGEGTKGPSTNESRDDVASVILLASDAVRSGSDGNAVVDPTDGLADPVRPASDGDAMGDVTSTTPPSGTGQAEDTAEKTSASSDATASPSGDGHVSSPESARTTASGAGAPEPSATAQPAPAEKPG
ncbi:MAG: hypothetical protein J6D54_08280, partial [Olsenella sp.]|nr:hypothetical protein [Olsenella sp.]